MTSASRTIAASSLMLDAWLHPVPSAAARTSGSTPSHLAGATPLTLAPGDAEHCRFVSYVVTCFEMLGRPVGF